MLRISIVSSAIAFFADATAAEIRLYSSVACSSRVVRLADIAELLDADLHFAAALADIPLCPAPTAGSSRTLTQHDVRQLLALSGVERSNCLVTGCESVIITADSSAPRASAKRSLAASGVRQAAFTLDFKQDHPQKSVSKAPPEPKPAAEPQLVQKNSLVTISARAAGIRITASGRALEPGIAGQTINVELADTKQRVLACVTGPQAVEIAIGD